MATYLVDYENVHKNGLVGIQKLSEGDTVIIFVGNTINNMPIETVMSILNSLAQIKIKKMKKTADNYLDFQLATCLGSLVTSSGDKEFFVISNDRGFEAITDYWRHNKIGIKVEQRNTIVPTAAATDNNAMPTVAPTTFAKLDNATKKLIRGIVKGEQISPGSYTGIYNLFLNESEKQEFRSGLARLFKQGRAERLYDLLKDTFEQYTAPTG
ncbi:MAG: hypothetical protein LBL27_00690 [Coriobacteriales bacterium]|jgi:hypothetical protein|nr:hypothetical protein [Coriobacteriales bacterium]